MQVLKVEPKKAPVVMELDDSLEAMSAIVGGRIEAISPFNDSVDLICHEEGKLLGSPPNRAILDEAGNVCDVICGTFFLCGAPLDSEYYISLTKKQIQTYQKRFAKPECFLRLNNRILVFPMEVDNNEGL